ncbi:MAG: 4-hydroxy-3-methylbut-2-enyl diphosphate reductase [Planctomycetota bacterium]|nr:4-hydroxy-3-methylbut-2-enyl diphosphate reductase [Planctomycetota bacterium]
MQVIHASDMGMCFGVRDALAATRSVDSPSDVTIHGELVHNPIVSNELSKAGFHQTAEESRHLPILSPIVLITAHGISNKERQRLEKSGKRCLDTTCPLVRKVHDAASELAAEGRLVLLIGKAGHVEVQRIVEDLDCCVVISSLDEVQSYPQHSIGIISQSTMPEALVREVSASIRRLNPKSDIRQIDTVCLPTKQRQSALQDLLSRVQAVVVVGGSNSNNTRRLVQLCETNGTPAFQVERASQLNPDWFREVDTVGLTAGTSTLDETIDEVERSILEIDARRFASP